MDTGEKTFETDINGDELYQVLARKALPILVRQAKAQQTITYTDLADELEMLSRRDSDYNLWGKWGNILWEIGNALKKLEKILRRSIPLINVIIIRKDDLLPGKDIDIFLTDRDQFKNCSNKKEKRLLQDKYLQELYNFQDWDKVLLTLGLTPIEQKNIIPKFKPKKKSHGKGGESAEHKAFKEYISLNPQVLGEGIKKKPFYLPKIEHQFRTFDKVDVLFKVGKRWIGVEAKAIHSDTEDILRGLFQCVKYKALLKAEQMEQMVIEIKTDITDIKVVLAVEGDFPKELIAIKNTLGIKVVDNIK